jgi:hypothetical protein
MNPSKSRKNARRSYQKHGHYLLKRAVKELGSRAIDRRTQRGRALMRWRSEVLRDLGGEEAVSAQKKAVLDLAVKTKLLLDSVDVWLLQQPSLVNARKRCLFPIALQRQQLADALARYMTQLGLGRKAKRIPMLNEYLAATTVPTAAADLSICRVLQQLALS